MKKSLIVVLFLALSIVISPIAAHEGGEPIPADVSEGVVAGYDIVFAQVSQIGSNLIFQMIVDGDGLGAPPEPTGAVGGANVLSYVWPTSLDSSVVGFEAAQGILALAVTAHPDFDDTPLWDENNDGDPQNDGGDWHSHWVVLVADETCGTGGLKVKDIPEGETPAVPPTWPELPILIDSPDYGLDLFRNEVVVTVPYEAVGFVEAFNFDGVTAGLQVNADLHNPFLCVIGVSDIASGDLSLPGVMGR